MSTAIAIRPADQLVGNYRKPDEVTSLIARAREIGHVISPATSCGYVPDGFGVAVTTVYINPDPKADKDVYEQGKELALTKVGLEKISKAVGISWDSQKSHRVDDRSDPHYCEFLAVGYVQDFDGRPCELSKTRAVDLREGSDDIKDIRKKAAKAVPKRDPENQIMEARRHIVALAETKAQNRAIRSIGLKSTYTAEELKKPFIAIKLAFTGQSDNPETQLMLTKMKACMALGAANMLFGPQTPQLSFTASEPPALNARPDQNTIDGTIEDDDSDQSIDINDEPGDEPAPTVQAQRSNGLVKFGKHKDKKYSDESIPVDYLEWLLNKYIEGISDPEKAQYIAANMGERNAIADQIDVRKG